MAGIKNEEVESSMMYPEGFYYRDFGSALIGILVLFAFFPGSGQKGQFFDSLSCPANPKEKFAIYLPAGHSQAQKYPVIFFEEPGGRAALPVQKYQALADKYQLLLVSPYGSRNGPYEPSVEATYSVLEELVRLYSIDHSAIFLSGFSGGARLSTHLAMNDPQFRGVIACGATFPENQRLNRKIPYAIVIGNRDMNYVEAVHSLEYLTEIQCLSQMVEFDGNHKWPDPDAYEQAVAWQLSQIGMLPESSTSDYAALLVRVKELVSAGEFLKAFAVASNAISTYSGTLDVGEMVALEKEIEAGPEFMKQRKNRDKTIRNEEDQLKAIQTSYARMLNTLRPDTAFLSSEWVTFRATYEKYAKAKDTEKRLSGERLLEFGKLLGVEQSYFLFGSDNFLWALNSARIWSVFAPNDPYAWVMIARIEASLGKNDEALSALNEAKDLGFADWPGLNSDAAFMSLKELPGYQNLTGN